MRLHDIEHHHTQQDMWTLISFYAVAGNNVEIKTNVRQR